MAVCQNLVPLVNIKIAGKWMFIPLKMVLLGIDPYPYLHFSPPVPSPWPRGQGVAHGALLRLWQQQRVLAGSALGDAEIFHVGPVQNVVVGNFRPKK